MKYIPTFCLHSVLNAVYNISWDEKYIIYFHLAHSVVMPLVMRFWQYDHHILFVKHIRCLRISITFSHGQIPQSLFILAFKIY